MSERTASSRFTVTQLKETAKVCCRSNLSLSPSPSLFFSHSQSAAHRITSKELRRLHLLAQQSRLPAEKGTPGLPVTDIQLSLATNTSSPTAKNWTLQAPTLLLYIYVKTYVQLISFLRECYLTYETAGGEGIKRIKCTVVVVGESLHTQQMTQQRRQLVLGTYKR